MRPWVLSSILLIICTLQARGQSDSLASYGPYAHPFQRAFICSLGDDFAATAAAPFRFTGRQWAIGGSVAAGALLIFSQDENIRHLAQNHRKPWSNKLSANLFEPIGDLSPQNTLAWTLSGIYATSLLLKDQPLQKATLTSVKAIAVSGILVNLLKFTTGRARPYLNHGNNNWFNSPLKSENRSFASGHTIVCFAVASSFAYAYPEKAWVGILGYSLAGLTGLSRIHDDQHWASDVFIGAVLGWSIGKLIVKSDHWTIRINEVNSKPVLGLLYQF